MARRPGDRKMVVKVESGRLYLFSFDLFFIFLFLELRVGVRVMRSWCHISVTGHMIHGRI